MHANVIGANACTSTWLRSTDRLLYPPTPPPRPSAMLAWAAPGSSTFSRARTAVSICNFRGNRVRERGSVKLWEVMAPTMCLGNPNIAFSFCFRLPGHLVPNAPVSSESAVAGRSCVRRFGFETYVPDGRDDNVWAVARFNIYIVDSLCQFRSRIANGYDLLSFSDGTHHGPDRAGCQCTETEQHPALELDMRHRRHLFGPKDATSMCAQAFQMVILASRFFCLASFPSPVHGQTDVRECSLLPVCSACIRKVRSKFVVLIC